MESDLPPDRVIDGRDITSLMFEQDAGPVRDTHLHFNRSPEIAAIRQGDWKLIFNAGRKARRTNGDCPGLPVGNAIRRRGG